MVGHGVPHDRYRFVSPPKLGASVPADPFNKKPMDSPLPQMPKWLQVGLSPRLSERPPAPISRQEEPRWPHRLHWR